MNGRVGFWDSVWGWVGKSPEQLVKDNEAAQDEIAARLARHAERMRPTEERIAANFATIVSEIDPAVLEAPRIAWKTLATVRQTIADAEARLAELVEHPPATPAAIDRWVDRKARLELAIPMYRAMAIEPQAAYEAAVEAARAALKAAWQPHRDATSQARVDARKAAQEMIDAADRAHNLMDSVRGRINTFVGTEPTP